ncbi:MAG: hypothetical protein EVJ46_00970 [Candidatus Acididesulfobacter guangdongensis]|jgi:hypothetical protein|uniref:DUF2007 domain-containing protein n=1 Tax=Acididesulfobacter guangdongensis TaxID=2597225 RepID=A0A519BHU8_ACIG2|nr:MAG: hypothetical protein EVJ46_00970 [Candidatus Acididesulfobacter guangdongensis]
MAKLSSVGTIYNAPIRVDYNNGDFDKAEDTLKKSKIAIVGRNVASITPYHATIFVNLEDEANAKKILEGAGIKMYPVEPYF